MEAVEAVDAHPAFAVLADAVASRHEPIDGLSDRPRMAVAAKVGVPALLTLAGRRWARAAGRRRIVLWAVFCWAVSRANFLVGEGGNHAA